MSTRGYWITILFLLVALVGQCAGPSHPHPGTPPPVTTVQANSNANGAPCMAGGQPDDR